MGLRRIVMLCALASWATGYKQGDNVTLYVNKVGPYHNPQETYHYYTLPVCRPEKVSVASVRRRRVRGPPQRTWLCHINVTETAGCRCSHRSTSAVLYGRAGRPIVSFYFYFFLRSLIGAVRSPEVNWQVLKSHSAS